MVHKTYSENSIFSAHLELLHYVIIIKTPVLHPQVYDILFDRIKLDIYVVIPSSLLQLKENKFNYQTRFHQL